MNDLKTKGRSITVVVGGDFCPTPEVEDAFLSKQRGADWFLGDAAGLFRESDLGIVNQECVFAVGGNPIAKVGPCLKAHPETIGLLTCLGVKLVTTANNHIRDFGDDAVLETLRTCRAHNIATVGSGQTIEHARKVYYGTFAGRRLAVINVAENEFASAGRCHAGANPLDLIDLLADITEARRQATHVILIVHGGLESTHYPSPQSVKLMRFLAEQGITAIIRHHPHYVQGYEVWKGVPIFYSVGNFLYFLPGASLPGWRDAMVIAIRIAADNTCTFVVHGFAQCLQEPRLLALDGKSRESFLNRVAAYSSVINDPAALQREWHAATTQRRQEYYALLTLPNALAFRAFRRLGWLNWVRPFPRKRHLFEDFLRCEAHREAFLDVLEEDRFGGRPAGPT